MEEDESVPRDCQLLDCLADRYAYLMRLNVGEDQLFKSCE